MRNAIFANRIKKFEQRFIGSYWNHGTMYSHDAINRKE